MNTVLKSIIASLLRNWLAAILAIVFANHWISADEQNQVTTWFSSYADVIATTFLAALVPVILGLYAKLREKFQALVGRRLPAGSTQADVKEVVANSTFRQIITINPSPSVIRSVAQPAFRPKPANPNAAPK